MRRCLTIVYNRWFIPFKTQDFSSMSPFRSSFSVCAWEIFLWNYLPFICQWTKAWCSLERVLMYGFISLKIVVQSLLEPVKWNPKSDLGFHRQLLGSVGRDIQYTWVILTCDLICYGSHQTLRNCNWYKVQQQNWWWIKPINIGWYQVWSPNIVY